MDARQPAPTLQDPPFDFRKYVQLFLKYKWVFLVVFCGVTALVAYLTMRVPKVYAAVTTVQINPRTPRVLSEIKEVVELGTGTYWSNKEFFQTQYHVIGSRAVARRVVEREGLDRDPDFLGLTRVRDKEKLAELTRTVDAVDILARRIAVQPVEGSHVVRIRVEDFDPARAVRLSVSVAHAYKDINLEHKMRETLNALKTLRTQRDDLKKALEASEQRLVEFKRSHGILTVSLADRQNVVTQDLLSFSAQLTRAEAEMVELEAKLEQVRKPDPVLVAAEVQELESKNRVIASMLERRERLLLERDSLLATYREKHPKVDSVDRRLRRVEAAIAAARKEVRQQVDARRRAEVRRLERQVASTRKTYDGLKRLVDRTNAKAQRFNKKEIDFIRLQREVEQNRRMYALVSKRFKEVDIAKEIHNNNVSVLDEAREARLVRPRLMYNLSFALALGALSGLVVVAFLNFLDKTVKSQDDIERVLGLTFLGIVPTVRDDSGAKVKDPAIHVHTHPRSTVAELCRTVRTNIQFMSPDQVLKKLVVTSAAPLEGKTTVTISLGISIAQAGKRVLVVSSDMRRPRVHEPFGFRGAKGISNWIVDDATTDEILCSTVVPNLHMLPCGPIPPNPAEILQADKFRRLVEELERRFDQILFDSPPVGIVSDPLILSVLSDGVILVVRAGSTSKEMVRQAHKKLRAVNAHILGCVLNNLDLKASGYGYDYYQRGYYAPEVEKRKASAG
jgi:capsular exopolysaccharide synthesis family protein